MIRQKVLDTAFSVAFLLGLLLAALPSRAENDPADIPVDLVLDDHYSTDPTVFQSHDPDYEYHERDDVGDVETHYRTPNLIDDQNWSGLTYGNDPGGCCASISGSGPLYDQLTDTIMFSYGMSTIQQVIAINQVFQNTGISVDGYTYDMMFKRIGNGNNARDSLYVDIIIKDASGNEVEQKTYDLSGNPNDNWEYFHAIQLFQSHYLDPQNATVRIRGKDGGFWAGYYGPEVKDVDFRLIYRSDPCAADPLHDPSCNGYADAYAEQEYNNNCAANALYDSGCPGYQTAYYNQQCSADPLYAETCPGYEQAYYNQQCSANPLYDTGCPGYQQAYYDQQCSANPLYDSECPGYAQAYLDQQCSIDPLYDSTCDGYAEAYAQENILNENTTTSSETQISASQTEAVPVTDPEEIGMPSTTGDATVDAILGELNELPTTTVVMESSTVETVATVQETQNTNQETETSAEADATGEMEELVASVEIETESTESTEESGGDDSQSSDESKGESSDGRDPESEKKDSKKEKMKKAIAKKAASLAEQMSEAASLEAQQAAQAQVLALINYVPDFNTYSRTMNGGYLPDATGYADTQLPETKRGLRNGLAQQLLHEKMVEMQYNR